MYNDFARLKIKIGKKQSVVMDPIYKFKEFHYYRKNQDGVGEVTDKSWKHF